MSEVVLKLDNRRENLVRLAYIKYANHYGLSTEERTDEIEVIVGRIVDRFVQDMLELKPQ